MMKKIRLPLDDKIISGLNAGDRVLLTGIIYTARDATHKRLTDCIKNKKKLPLELKNQTIYYTGPAPAKPKQIIGSCGPTTSSRMDEYTPSLLRNNLKGMIGKGDRSKEVVSEIKKHKAVYFIAPGGCGALLSQTVKKCDLVAYGELGCEAIYKLKIKDFPAIVGIDCRGKNIYNRR
ncbi:MAG: Fe-S-containing hydro-lyase [bacterium]